MIYSGQLVSLMAAARLRAYSSPQQLPAVLSLQARFYRQTSLPDPSLIAFVDKQNAAIRPPVLDERCKSFSLERALAIDRRGSKFCVKIRLHIMTRAVVG